MEESGISAGTAILEMNLLSADDLGNAVRERILTVVAPLLQSKEGEFNFILSETMSAADLEYDPDLSSRKAAFRRTVCSAPPKARRSSRSRVSRIR